MRKIKNCLKLILISIFFIVPSSVFAIVFVSEEDDIGVSANINVDNFSFVEVNPDTVEVGVESDVLISLLDYLGNPISDHSIRIYIEGDSTGVVLTQPNDTDLTGETVGKIKSLESGIYKVRAVDDTYGYDITITSFDMFQALPLDEPVINPEPEYTKGTSNTISWTSESGFQYYAEVSKSSTFSTVISNSGWISSSQYTFSNLENGSMYFFRLRKRNILGGLSNWSNVVYSVQDASAPVITLLDITNMNDSEALSDDFIEIRARIEDNLSLVSQSTFCVLTGGSLYECASYTNLIGNIYTARIPFGELEKDGSGNLLNEYSFCIEADDEVGNIGRNCDIDIVLEVETAANIVEPVDQEFSFTDITLESLTYLPYTLIDNMVSTMSNFQMSLVSLLTAIIVFFIILSLYFRNIFLPFLYSIYLLILLFRKKKEYVVNGVAYNSETKEPLKYAIVRVLNSDDERIGWGISDEYGEFKIDIDEKKVHIDINRVGFFFPSTFITEKTDYPFTNIYTGGAVNFRNSNEVNISIPLDVKKYGFLGKELRKIYMVLSYVFLSLIFSFSVFLSFFLLGRNPSAFNFVLLSFNILDAVLIVRLVFEKIKKLAIVKDSKGKVVDGVTVIVKDFKSGKIKEKRVSDINGRYYFSLLPGEYSLDILNKDLELVEVEDGKQFSISGDRRKYFGRDLIVKEKGQA